MSNKPSFNKQFKKGTYPDQHWDESVRTNGPEIDSPSKVKKRQGVSLGSQVQANPGMDGKQDFGSRKRKR